MSACDNDGIPAAYEQLFHGFCHRLIANSRIQDEFHFRVSAGQCVTDHHNVRLCLLKVLSAITSKNANAEAIKKIRHRRVHVRVAADDGEPLLLEHPSEGGHCRSANAD